MDAEFNGLPWWDGAIPVQVGGCVGVGARHSAVPTAGYQGAVRILPGNSPAIDGTGTGVADTNGSGEAVVPLVAHHIGAAGALRTYVAGG